MIRKTLLSVSIATALSVASGSATAAAGFSAGFRTGCTVCAGAMDGAFGVIRLSITLSEQVIGRVINDGPYYSPIPIGFPMLQTQINGSMADSTQKITTTITNMTNDLINVMDRVAEEREAISQNIKAGVPAIQEASDARGGCQSLEYGRIVNSKPRSSLGWGYQYVTRGSFESEDGESVGSRVSPPTTEMTDDQAIEVALVDIGGRAKQTMNRDFNALKARSAAAGQPGASTGRILNPSILYSAETRTLDMAPDEYGVSDDERADYLIQYLMADAPTHADALGQLATTPEALARSVDGQIDGMEMTMAMAVLNSEIELRRASMLASGPEAFLAEAMGEGVPETSSKDALWHRISHYRQRDDQWLERVSVDENYALAQQVQMEAEHLALKYERWKTARNNTLMLAQAAANMMEKERK